MNNRILAYVAMAASLALPMIAGCSRPSLSAPSAVAPPAARSTAAVTVTAVHPNTASTNGTTVVRVVGTGFEPGAIVTLGAVATGATVVNSTTITATVPMHGAGTVDVVVTTPSAQSGTLSSGFTYAIVPRATVTAVSPNIGSTEGGTPLTVSGTEFQSGATVTLGGVEITPFVYLGSIFLTAPAHATGLVDVVVINPGAEPHTLANAYTYAPPESFDFNGTWDGEAGTDSEFPLQFVIENNNVMNVRCGGSVSLTFETPAPVSNGAFSFVDAEGTTMTGKIVSPAGARGTISTASCRGIPWSALKR